MLKDVLNIDDLLNIAPYGVFIIDLSGKIIFASKMAAKRLNKSAKEMIGKTLTDYFPIDISEKRRLKGIEAINSGISQSIEDRVGDRWYFSKIIPIKDKYEKIISLAIFSDDITDRKRVEEELQKSEERFRNLYDNAPVGYFEYNLQGNITQVNRTELKMLGYTAEEMIGQPCWKFIVDDVAREQILAKLKGVRPPAVGLERTYRRKDGTTFPVLFEDRLLFDEDGHISGIRTAIQDITVRKQAEKALREKTKLLQNIIDTTSDLVAVTDLEGNFKFIGPSHRFLGYDPDSLVGRNVMELVHPDDYQEAATAFAEFLANREDGRKVEYRYRRADGDYLWFETVGKFILDDAGNPKEILFSSRDFTAHKRAEGELKRIEWMLSRKPVSNVDAQTENHDQGYGDLTELNRDGIILKSIGHERLKSFANDYLELLGTSSAIYEVNGDYAFGIFASGWCRMMDSASRKLCNTPDNVEALNSGRWLCHESCWSDCAKKTIAKRAEVDIECNGGIRMYAVPIYAGGNVIGVINFGYGDPPKDPEKLKMLADVYHLNYDDLLREASEYDSRPPYIIEMAKKRLNSTATLIGSMVETTQAMEALRNSEEKHRRLFETMAQGVVYQAADGTITSANPAAEKILGLSLEQMRDKTVINPRWRMIEEDGTEVPGTNHPAMIALRTGRTVGPVIRGVFHPDRNTYVWLSITIVPLFQPGEIKPFNVYATFEDVTERKRMEETLQKSEERLTLALDSVSDAVWDWRVDTDEVYFSSRWYTMLGYKPYEFPQAFETWRKLLHPDDLSDSEAKIFMHLDSAEPFAIEFRMRTKGNHWRWILARGKTVEQDDQGKAVRMLGTHMDITERKQSEEERKKLQDQLSQAQKMESVGRLAGGVAHDFNNMLGVILGHTELALLQTDENHDLYADLKEIQTAAKRSADITKQLLAYARKQTISPRQLDLNDTVESMLNMLRRLIGENIDLVWQPAAHLWPVKMDPSQIDQILANLCINARDAISGVGKLTIETGRKSFDEEYCSNHLGFIPGDFVMLAVSDNGCGMDKATLNNLFEPFFTTKDVGKGTGLGLATVYGIIKQNNGFINVYSEPDQGSTFKIYLPRLVADEDTDKAVPDKKAAAGGTETILLVEDEPSILRMTRMMLERKGYTVISAATPTQAMEKAKNHSGAIDLLMTDVVMPEMNGRDLAEEITALFPGIRLLFMSGYTSNVIAHHGILDEGVDFIQKPFSMADMTEKVRELLDMATDKN